MQNRNCFRFFLLFCFMGFRLASNITSSTAEGYLKTNGTTESQLVLSELKKFNGSKLLLLDTLDSRTFKRFADGRYQKSWFSNYFPDYCCPLEVTRIGSGDFLPEDSLIAGVINGRKYAYVLYGGYIRFKSERPGDPAFNYDGSILSLSYYEVVTNPHRCTIKNYFTRYSHEIVPQHMNGNRYFFPKYSGEFMARIGNQPARYYDTIAYYIYGDYYPSHSTYASSGVTIKGVDCLGSLSTMTQAKLIDIKFDRNIIDSISKTGVTYFKRSYINNSTEAQSQKLEFVTERANTINVELSESFASEFCYEESKSEGMSRETTEKYSFSDTFSYSASVGIDAWFFSASAETGKSETSQFESGLTEAFSKAFSWSRSSCSSRSSGSAYAKSHTVSQSFSYSDEITIPPKTIATASALCKPFKGTIPYRMTFELIGNNDNRILKETLQKGLAFFKLSNGVSVTEDGRVLVTFDGKISVDAGYEILVAIESESISEMISGNQTEPMLLLQGMMTPK